MKTLTGAMLAHIASPTTTLAWCWDLTLTDGTVFHYTDHDLDINISGTNYLSSSGFKRTAISFTEGLQADNLDLVGLIDTTNVSQADLIAGRYDNATVYLFMVNYADLTMLTIPIVSALLGQVSFDRKGWHVHVDGISKVFEAKFGEVTSPGCRADFGDSRCTFNLATVTDTGSVTTVTDSRSFTTTLAHGAGYYNLGKLTWTSGPNNGRKMEVKSWDGTTVVLQLPMPAAFLAGNTFSISKGCNKIFGDGVNGCASNSNQANFQGEPDLPGIDNVTKNVSFIGIT